jgi:hypothetical protein
MADAAPRDREPARSVPSMSGAQERRRPRAGVLSLAESPPRSAGPMALGLAAAAIVLWILWSALDVLLLAFAGVLLAVALRGLAGWVSAHSPLSPAWSLAMVVATLAKLFRGRDPVPDELRARLLEPGFARIDVSGLLAADRYALPEEIERASRTPV